MDEEKNVRVPSISIGNKLEQERAVLFFDSPFACEADGLEGSDDVHAVYLETGNLVATGKVGGVGGAAFRRGAHTVLVVFAYEHGWEVPELGLLG